MAIIYRLSIPFAQDTGRRDFIKILIDATLDINKEENNHNSKNFDDVSSGGEDTNVYSTQINVFIENPF